MGHQSVSISLSDRKGYFVKSMFLPKNYPNSVSDDYIKFTAYQFVQSVTGTIAGTISTQAMLHALGLGAGVSMGMAATTNWIVKDGFGLLGGVIYAGLMGSKFDASPKKYRFWAALSIQGATFVEILTPFFPTYFVLMASIANIGKNIGWLASGATRAAIHKGFTKADNLGDVTAKSGAQGTAAGLVGTGLGIGVSWALSSSASPTIDPSLLFSIFAPLSILNLVAAYLGNFSVVTRTLNEERLQLAIKPFIKNLVNFKANADDILSPNVISKKESVFMSQKALFNTLLLLEPCLTSLVHSPSSSLLNSLAGDSVNSSYRIYITPENVVCLWFLKGIKDTDKLTGYFHANLIREILDRGPSDADYVYRESKAILSSTCISDILERKGWEINNLHLGGKGDSSLTIKSDQ